MKKIIHLKSNRKSAESRIQELIEDRQTFRHEKTRYTEKIILPEYEFYYSDSQMLPKKVLGYCRELKKMVQKNEVNIEVEGISNRFETVKYFEFSQSINRMKTYYDSNITYFDCLEVDVSAAYYNAALILKLISPEFHRKCMGLKKIHRLKLIGSMATIKYIESYVGGELVLKEEKKSDLHRSAWFLICNYVDMCMEFMKNEIGEAFLFYWVDGIYFERIFNIEEINFRCEEKFGFNLQTTDIPKIDVINKGGNLKVIAHKNDGSKKEFSPKVKGRESKIYGKFEEHINKTL